jgi:rhomboid-like protein
MLLSQSFRRLLSPSSCRLALAPFSRRSLFLPEKTQRRSQHHRPQRSQQNARRSAIPQTSRSPVSQEGKNFPLDPSAGKYHAFYDDFKESEPVWSQARVRYLRPAIWALTVSGGIFTGLAYLEAKEEVKSKKSKGWFEAAQLNAPRRGPPTPTELAMSSWQQLNPISQLSCGIIGVNAAVHLSSYVVPSYWLSLWHTPVRNVNYTQFSSMFVHSGPFHLFVNMYALYNFMVPVGYSRAFEGNSHHLLSFFLATGVLSGFAQHLSTLITPQKGAIPEAFIRCGGASGALLAVLGLFCMEYPTAGLGIMFVPVHFDAQYVLPAIMIFDFVGMVRGYSFVNFGHAVWLYISCIDTN